MLKGSDRIAAFSTRLAKSGSDKGGETLSCSGYSAVSVIVASWSTTIVGKSTTCLGASTSPTVAGSWGNGSDDTLASEPATSEILAGFDPCSKLFISEILASSATCPSPLSPLSRWPPPHQSSHPK
ncbi:hypothetical protein Nepgr_019194 [Nepenthes gracilis]|uniref:Uncharacterized protein n=1 Tax=Nepenthes gracilis TaxID=150966 RepID=A0AAD3XU53_NEPGR|nr:hypothetical protein Nepgr_019194 [Nepenthes gracilis]